MPKQTQSTELAIKDLKEHKAAFVQMMPTSAQKDRLFQILCREIQQNPDLASCSRASILDCAVEAAKLNLDFSGTMQHLHMIPFKKKATLIVGFRGLMELMRRGSKEPIAKIESRCVYENDKFHVNESEITHEYNPFAESRGDFVGVYCLITYENGTRQWETMSMADVDKIRNMSLAKNSTPWKNHYEEMARKTVIRRIAKYVPMSAETADAISQFDTNEFETIDMPVGPPSGTEETLAAIEKKEEPEPPEEGNIFEGALAAEKD